MKMAAFAATLLKKLTLVLNVILLSWKGRGVANEFLSCLHTLRSLYVFSNPLYPHTIIHSIIISDLALGFTMISSPVAAGKRPEFKQAQSGIMGWPRLIPVKEVQKPAHSEPSQVRRTNTAPFLHDPKEQAVSPTGFEKPTPTEPPLPSVHSAAGSAHSTEEFGTALIERPDPLENGAIATRAHGSDIAEASRSVAEAVPGESASECKHPKCYSTVIDPLIVNSSRRSASTRRAICSY